VTSTHNPLGLPIDIVAQSVIHASKHGGKAYSELELDLARAVVRCNNLLFDIWTDPAAAQLSGDIRAAMRAERRAK
jgi:hypothetical protein